MRINLPTLSAYRDLVAQCSANIDDALPRAAFLGDETVPEAVRPAVTKWSSAKKALTDIDAAFYELGDALQAILLDDTRNEAWKGEQSRSTVASFGKRITAAASTAQDKASAALDIARRAALPQRPGPQDTAQEARIAGIKSDILLLTSNTKDDDRLLNLLAGVLTEAMATKDALTMWVLTGSGWVNGPLLESRDPQASDVIRYQWDQRSSQVLAGKGDLATCLEIYRDLADPQVGVPALLMACGGFLTGILRDVETWHPAHTYGAQSMSAGARSLGEAMTEQEV